MITLSQIVSNQVQADGNLLIHEQHTASDGVIYDHIYFADPASDVDAVCIARGAVIGAELDKREAVLREATNFEIPLTDVEIMRRLTPAEWAEFQGSTDTNISYFRAVFAKTRQIYRTDPLTIAGFDALVAAGLLTADRVAEVLA